MSNAIAHDLAMETAIELANHKEFEGDASNAAHYVLYKAVREDRVFVPRREDLPEILKALVSLVRGGSKLRAA